MVGHPSEYPWSSYRFNALDEANTNVTMHHLYKRLGSKSAERQEGYRALFRSHLSGQVLDDIRESTDKSWVLGSSRFKRGIERKLSRRVSPISRGGDRKSEEYRSTLKSIDTDPIDSFKHPAWAICHVHGMEKPLNSFLSKQNT